MPNLSKEEKQSKHETDVDLKRLLLFILSQATIVTTDYSLCILHKTLYQQWPQIELWIKRDKVDRKGSFTSAARLVRVFVEDHMENI